MSYLYVNEPGSIIGVRENRIEVRDKDDMLRSVPIETLETIQIYGRSQVTTACMTECLKRGINMVLFSSNGAYYGRLISTNHVNVARQRMQASLSQEFCLQLSKRIIDAKIHNQTVILRRYARNSSHNVEEGIRNMTILSRKIETCTDNDQLMGYEGAAARIYFAELGQLIDPAFAFKGRNRRPPKDPFNSLISLGYSIILNEIYGKIEGKGLNPYFGILHQDREKHPTLASDLMEEWRAVLVDSIAMSLLNGHELGSGDFYTDEDSGGVFLSKDAFKKFIAKFEHKLHVDNRYLPYVDYSVSFRRALDLQVNQLCHAMEQDDPSVYQPVRIR